jgi:hypothetical protein
MPHSTASSRTYGTSSELSLTYAQISIEKTRTQHRLLTHYLPLYFPEIERHYHASRSEWLLAFLQLFPTPALITRLSMEDFVERAWPVVGRKVSKQRLLEDIYRTAQSSIGIPVEENSEAVAMFRVVLGEMIRLCQLRDELEQRAALHLKDNADFQRLQQLPGIGPILALTILAEAGDLRRFNHHRQFLKFCGLDLSTQQSGQFRGTTKLSKYGNSRLRCAFWMAATVAVRLRENSFRDKFERYLRRDPLSADRKRMAYVAVAAKMARVAHGIIKTGTDFRCFHEAAAPSGRAASPGPSRP